MKQRPFLWKEITTLSTELSTEQKYLFSLCSCSLPDLKDTLPFLYAPIPLLCVGLPFLLPRKRKPGRKEKVAVAFPPRPQPVRTLSHDSPGRCGRPESCTKRLSWPVPRPPLPPLPPPAPLPPPPPPLPAAPPPRRRFLSQPWAADMTR